MFDIRENSNHGRFCLFLFLDWQIGIDLEFGIVMSNASK